MKRLIAASLAASLFTGPVAAQAFYYEGKCVVPQGKFKKCYLDFSSQETLRVRYKDFEYQNLNREIQGREIQHVAMGEQAKHRWEVIGPGIYALGPFGALFLLWKKKTALFSVEYGKGKKANSLLFGVKKKQGGEVAAQFQRISEKGIDFGSSRF